MENKKGIPNKSIYKFTFNQQDDVQTYSVKKHLALLFLNNRSKHYRTQTDILLALKDMGFPHSQSAISKNLSILESFPFEYHDQVFAICNTPKGYCLLNQEDYPKSLRYALESKKVLARDIVFYEHGLNLPQMFIFWVHLDVEKQKIALELFKKAFYGSYVDIFIANDRLIILLDYSSSRFPENSKILKNFFSKENDHFLQMIGD